MRYLEITHFVEKNDLNVITIMQDDDGEIVPL